MHEFIKRLSDEHGRTFPVDAVGTRGEYVVSVGDELRGRRVSGVVFSVDMTWEAFDGDELIGSGAVPAHDFFIVHVAPTERSHRLPFLGTVA